MTFRAITFHFVVLAILTAFVAAAPTAAQPGPVNGKTYTCYGNPAWESLEFNIPQSGPDRRGIVDVKPPNKPKDNKKVALLWKNNSNFWEFTLPKDGVQCKDLVVAHAYPWSYLIFNRCQGTPAASFNCRGRL